MIFPKFFPVRSTPRVSRKGPADWLRKKITVEEAEADIGCENREWETLKTKIGLNDELWTFSSPADYWQQFRGSRGVALLRDGKIIEADLKVEQRTAPCSNGIRHRNKLTSRVLPANPSAGSHLSWLLRRGVTADAILT